MHRAFAATRDGADATGIDARANAIMRPCRSVVRDQRVESPVLAHAIGLVGPDGATELIAICGYYALLASFIIIGGHDRDL